MTAVQVQFTDPKRENRRLFEQAILLAILLLLAVALLTLYWPINYRPVVQLNPAQSYGAAIVRLEALQAKDKGLALSPGCATQVMTHGQQVERALVLLHGYRNCPAQLAQVGAIFYEQGYNVIIPRMPHHGLADVLTHDQAHLTADELVVHVTEAVDIAQGLGGHVTVAGMSTGAVLAGWAAQQRADIERAVLIAPFFGPQAIPAALNTPAINLFNILPNIFLWQDDQLQATVPNPPQVYPQNATRALSQILQLGAVVRNNAGQPPTAGALVVITNANDDTVDNQMTAAVVAAWQRTGYEPLETYEFSADLGLDHDLIDPAHPKQKIDLVYPTLIDLIAR